MYPKGRAWIEINRKALLHDLSELRSVLHEQTEPMPAIKANAYGHGAIEVESILREAGVRAFCVASVDEAVELRRAGSDAELLVLGYTHPLQFDELFEYDVTQAVVDLEYARELSAYGRELKVHVAVDTGMHRIGERWEDMDRILSIFRLPGLLVKGVFSHLCVADELCEDKKRFTEYQISSFKKVIDGLHENGFRDFCTHLQASHGVLNHSELCFDFARLGIALYGADRGMVGESGKRLDLWPVLSLKARVVSIRDIHKGEGIGYGLTYTADRDMRLATVSIGYADGLNRALSNRGSALINGRRVKIIGRLCMDQLMVDVSGVADVKPGDEAVFIGRSKDEEISAIEVAELLGTIPHEVLSGLGARLQRIVV